MWTPQQLTEAAKEDVYIAVPNPDGTLHAPTWIWLVAVDGELYVRSYNGVRGRWYTAARREGRARVRFGSVKQDVTLEFPDDEALNQKIDAAYQAKYAGSPYVDGPVNEPMRSATVRLVSVE